MNCSSAYLTGLNRIIPPASVATRDHGCSVEVDLIEIIKLGSAARMPLFTRKSKITIGFAIVLVAALLGACGESSGVANNAGNGVNRAPTIAGNPPAAVAAGNLYTFTPQASDPDGDTLQFSAMNVPSWASFDAATGTVSGMPSIGDIGMYTNIVVSVSDGQQSVSMPAFEIDVTQIGTASTTLSWIAPTQNNDGTALADLAGYVIYYGTSSRNYTNEIRISNPSVTTYFVDGLTAGRYYFAAKAFSTSGAESGYSAEAVADLTGP
jgi:hypothetical protein